jgi:large subunit ribosomal protein L19e
MDLKSQKNIAARLLKCGKSRIWIDPVRIGDVSEAITSADIRRLIGEGAIKKLQKKGVSSFRKRKNLAQKKKGRRKGRGSRKGSIGTRLNRKKFWIKRIRVLRRELRQLRAEGKIEKATYRSLYLKSKSGFFRSKSHLMNYIERNNLLKVNK